MSRKRVFALLAIYGAATVAWIGLASVVDVRTDRAERKVGPEVDALWGPSGLVQNAPSVVGGPVSSELATGPLESDVEVRFEHHDRAKGLLWFSTYQVDFRGSYRVRAPKGWEGSAFLFALPAGARFVEGLRVLSDGVEVASDSDAPVDLVRVELADSQPHVIEVAFSTRARNHWVYLPGVAATGDARPVRRFRLSAETNFVRIDYPPGTMSPTRPAESTDEGSHAVWDFDGLRTEEGVGIEMPSRPNAGSTVARLSFFAPVGLLFFFAVVFAVVVVRRISLHPVHYLFVAAGFLAFHVLLAYLADVIDLQVGFAIATAASVLLVTSYMRVVAGIGFGVFFVGLAQAVFLVGMSYACLWEGRTGLAITVGGVATLFALMQATARVRWDEVFA